MKKFIILALILNMTAPVFAVCSLTGFCAPSDSALSSPGLSEKYMPNNLNNLQKPDAFMPQYRKPYSEMLINTEQEQQNTTPGLNNESSYNSNCQFGVCIPSSGMLEEP